MNMREVASHGHHTCRYPWITVVLTLIANLSCLCNSAYVPVKTLYDVVDEVVILNNDTFQDTVFSSQQAWFLQFYSSWCGHCVQFAPTWKAFAKDIKSWQVFVKLGAIDCADKKNSETCRKFIDVGFPTLRFFKALQTNETGDISKGPRDIASLRHALIDHMTKHTQDVLQSHWPVLTSVTIDWLTNFFSRNDHPRIKMLAVIFEEELSYIGREVIMDMANRHDIQVVRVLKQETIASAIASKWKVKEYPSLFILKDTGQPLELLRSGTRETFIIALQNYSSKSGEKFRIATNSAFVMKIGRKNDTQGSQHEDYVTSSHIKNAVARSVVYMQDLESALIYSLVYEISLQTQINGDALRALKTYIAVLNKYFPGQAHVMDSLASLQRVLQAYTHVSNEEWYSMLQFPKGSQKNDVKWVGCQGSTTVYRGYPCGLWLLFHTLTISHGSMAATSPRLDVKEVLHAMKDYIHYFFGCRDCSINFEKESVTLDSSVKTLDDSVLWLWKVHNQVNKRLSGKLSEDPQHPKMQFPSRADCNSCHHFDASGEWNTVNVLSYLKRLYGVNNIALLAGDEYRHHELKQAVKKTKMSHYGAFSLGLDQTDISMCFLLYGLCLLLLFCIYVYVRQKRKRRPLKL